MPVNLNLKIEKKHLYLLLAIMIFLVGVGVVIGYTQPIPNPGHGADTILVDVPGQGEMTLQVAITNGLIGGANCQWKLSHQKGEVSTYPAISFDEAKNQKATGICACSDQSTVDAILADTLGWGGYLKTIATDYWICDTDTIDGCTKNYFAYLACG